MTAELSAPPYFSPPSNSWEKRVSEYLLTVDRNPWIREPIHPKQQQFLLLSDVREIFYGGAGGGGKSQALLLGALQYVDVPGYAALILRRTYKDLSLPKSLMHRAREYLGGTGASWNGSTHTLTFPAGSTITFGHANNPGDEHRYRSAEFQYIAFDELTEFEEGQYTFLFTRLRRPVGLGVPLRMRSASNPGGVGHTWVKERFIDQRSRNPRAVFIPAKLADNPSVDAVEYRASLAETDPLTRAQIEDGDWDAVEGGRFRPEWFRRFIRRGDHYLLDGRLAQIELIFLTADTAASTKAAADRTVLSVWGLTRCGQLLWFDMDAGRWEVPDILPRLERLYRQHGCQLALVEAVAAHSGQGILQAANRVRGLTAIPHTPDGDKLRNATEAIIAASAGKVWVPSPTPPWVADAMGELTRFTGDPKQDAHDDVVDTVASAARFVAGKIPQAKGRAAIPRVFA